MGKAKKEKGINFEVMDCHCLVNQECVSLVGTCGFAVLTYFILFNVLSLRYID